MSEAEYPLDWAATEHFRPTADHLPVLIWISGTDKLCTWFNRSWLDFVGRPMERELGNGWAENVHADDFDRCLDIYVSAFDRREPFRMEYRMRRHDGVYRWILDEGRPLYDDAGAFSGYIGCCLDIADQKRATDDVAASLERERRTTRTLQAAFLPPYLPTVEGAALQACYRPADSDAQLGGDWYDVFALRDGRVALSIGDVFGHGLEAAGAMVRLRETLRAVTGFIDDNPALILQLADRAFQSSHPGGIASAVFAIFDPATRRVEVANAGHPPPIVVSAGATFAMSPGAPPVGVVADSSFTVQELVLEPGDAFVLYTDGLTEVDHDAVGGERRLLEALAAGPLDADALVTKLTGNKQRDDVAMLVFSLLEAELQSLWHFTAGDAASTDHARGEFVEQLRRRGLDEASVAAAALVFGELVANVVRHAPGPIEVELAGDGTDLVLIVRDRGPTFAPGDGALPTDALAEGGRGYFLIGRYAELQRVRARRGGGNEVRVRIPRGRSGRDESGTGTSLTAASQ
ncbi:MAG TPA: SpoIIE family protein phosphatase [Candidatus Elarobacter sp.]|jgi:PAS domain S-box-containing protein